MTTTTATLNASVNPEGSATTALFVFGTDPALAAGTFSTNSVSLGSGTSASTLTGSLTSLTPNTTYYFRVVATNSAGTTSGAILSFTTGTATGTAPVATTQAATAVTSTTATLNASVNPEGSATTVNFVYGTSPTLASGTTTTTAQSIGAGTSAVAVAAPLPGLASNTTYYFRVVATNSAGTTSGAILSFTTGNFATAPIATTMAATALTTTTATLNASVNPEGSATTALFVFGTDPALAAGTFSTNSVSLGSGASPTTFTGSLTSLTPNTTYFFRVVATNSAGTTKGAILSFATGTSVTAPVATTEDATSVTSFGGRLNASVNPDKGATSVLFVYGTDPDLASDTFSTSAQSIGAGASAVAVTGPLTGLDPDTTYYFQVVATNSAGSSAGSILNFTTAFVQEATLSDFLGLGESEPAVYRPSTAAWYVQNPDGTTTTLKTFGWLGHDIPVAGDYDGVGHTQQAVYRPSTSQWFVLEANGTTEALPSFGWAGHDIPVPGDYDGVGHTEQAVYRPSTGQWFVRQPDGSAEIIATFGWSGHDIPVPGDYDGVGYTEPAVYRPSTGQWFVSEPENTTEQLPDFGWPGHDYPAPGDYDGVGYVEQAVYRPSTAQWFVFEPDGTTERLTTFGWTGHDLPTTTPIYSLVQTGMIGGISKSSLDAAASPLISEPLPTVSSVPPAPSPRPTHGPSQFHVVLKKPFPMGALVSTSRTIGKKYAVVHSRIHKVHVDRPVR